MGKRESLRHERRLRTNEVELFNVSVDSILINA